MPEIRPFNGVRYAPIDSLKDLVCPPYDVISPELQEELHELHPHNAVRLELPYSVPGEARPERYRRAAEQFEEWLASGVLVQDDAPGLYVYRQDYVTPEGDRGRVAGVLGALKLEEFGADAGVLPHERTMPGPKEDRLALIRACPVNISPIYAIYRGGGGLAPYYDSLANRPPDARFQDASGTLHRLWAVSSPADVEAISAAIAPGPLVIADGHHRYETALAHHEEQGGEPGGHDAVMCFCVDADAEDLVLYPFHRALRAQVPPEALRQRLLDDFGGVPLSRSDSSTALENSGADHPLLFRFSDGDVLVEVDAASVIAATGERPEPWRSLDVVALHEAVLPRLLPEGVDDAVFTKEQTAVEELIDEQGWTCGVLLRGFPPTAVIEVAKAGERMPQKASHFWPKALTGLVFRPLR